MKDFVLSLCLAATLSANPAGAEIDRWPKDVLARAGRNIAVTTCVACHMVSPDQTIQPVFGGAIPSFEEIANKPNVTLGSLAASMSACTGETAPFLPRCAPISSMSDRERTQIAAYIFSLRSSR
jgi:mono/diheme cytochrome c family protein